MEPTHGHTVTEHGQGPSNVALTLTPLQGTMTADEFKLAFRNHPAGVAVITADDGNGPVGFTASSVFSVSADPPLLVFSLSSFTSSAKTVANVDSVVVHLLGSHQLETARRFATPGADRFPDDGSWDRLPTGEPYLVHAPVWIRGHVVERLQMMAGGATVVALHAIEGHVSSTEGTAPLVYHNRTWHHLGTHSTLSD